MTEVNRSSATKVADLTEVRTIASRLDLGPRSSRSGSGPRDVAKSLAGPREPRWKGSEGEKVEGSGSKVRAVNSVASETIGA